MSTSATLIGELEDAVAHQPIGQRAKALQRVADLFTNNCDQLSAEQIALFDDVMSRLLKQIDVAARAGFGARLSDLAVVPPGVVRHLALDDAIEVAGPVLRGFEAISEETLVEGARTKSQSHLLAISQRRQISECVTDVLVERGNQQVAMSTTGNPGARFSDFGYSTIVRRAETDRNLAACIWARAEIPRFHLLTLFASASQAVRRELQSIDAGRAKEVESLIARAGDELQTYSRERSGEFQAACEHVRSLRDSGQLRESTVLAFASARRFHETAVALSLLGDAPIGFVERAMVHDKCDHLLVLAKSIGLAIDTVQAVLSIRTAGVTGSGPDLEEAGASYQKLSPETARRAIQYCRLWERTASSDAARKGPEGSQDSKLLAGKSQRTH
jgi:uncharacterized protein (DUF2336 family)